MQYNNDEYCLNCLNSFRTEIKLKSYEKVCKKREREGEREGEAEIKHHV